MKTEAIKTTSRTNRYPHAELFGFWSWVILKHGGPARRSHNNIRCVPRSLHQRLLCVGLHALSNGR